MSWHHFSLKKISIDFGSRADDECPISTRPPRCRTRWWHNRPPTSRGRKFGRGLPTFFYSVLGPADVLWHLWRLWSTGGGGWTVDLSSVRKSVVNEQDTAVLKCQLVALSLGSNWTYKSHRGDLLELCSMEMKWKMNKIVVFFRLILGRVVWWLNRGKQEWNLRIKEVKEDLNPSPGDLKPR